MATPFLQYAPVRDSYTLTPAYNVVETKLDGGRSRKRQDILGGTHIITPTWILNRGEYTRFMGFFRENILNSSRQFRMNLLTDFAYVMPHVCTTSGGAPKLVQQSGDAYFVSCVLEVTPNPCISFSLFLNNASGTPQITNAGTAFYTGDVSEFPIGRSVILVNTLDTASGWGGVTINVDATYSIQSHPTTFTIQPLNAVAINPAWTTLNGLSPPSYFPTNGACVLVPL